MKNNLKKLLVLLLAANMFAGTTLPTFAEEEKTVEGLVPTVTTETTEGTDENGNPVITVTITETIGGTDAETGEPVFETNEEGVEVNYEQTTTTAGDRTVTAELSDVTVTVTDTEEDSLVSIKPEDYEGKHYDTHAVNKEHPQANGLLNATSPDFLTPQGKPTDEDGNEITGYDYYTSGNGDATWAAVPVFMNIV